MFLGLSFVLFCVVLSTLVFDLLSICGKNDMQLRQSCESWSVFVHVVLPCSCSNIRFGQKLCGLRVVTVVVIEKGGCDGIFEIDARSLAN